MSETLMDGKHRVCAASQRDASKHTCASYAERAKQYRAAQRDALRYRMARKRRRGWA